MLTEFKKSTLLTWDTESTQLFMKKICFWYSGHQSQHYIYIKVRYSLKYIKSQLFGWGLSGVSDYQVVVLTDNAAEARSWSEGRWEMEMTNKIPSRWPLHENMERRSWRRQSSLEINQVSLQDLPGNGWKPMHIYCQTTPLMPILLKVQG